MNVTRKPRATAQLQPISTHLHPEIRVELKVAAARAGVTIPEKLHAILCREFRRSDLLPRDRETTSSRSA